MKANLGKLKYGKTYTGKVKTSYDVIRDGKPIGEIWKTPYNTHWQTCNDLSTLCNEKIIRDTEPKMLNSINKALPPVKTQEDREIDLIFGKDFW